MMPTISFNPLVPSALWLALAIGGAALLVWHARRRAISFSRIRWSATIALMSCALAAILVLLLNPTWTHEIPPPPGKPVLTVLLDATESMATPDAPSGQSRFAAAANLAQRAAGSLSDRFDVRVRTFDTTIHAVEAQNLSGIKPASSATDLAAAIASALDQEHAQGQAVMLLSDGIQTAPGGASRILDAVRVAKSMDAPLYTRTYGGQAHSLDLAVELQSSQDLAIVGQKVPLTARVVHHGLTPGKATVTLLQDGHEIDRREAMLSGPEETAVHFLLPASKIGVYSYEVRVDALPGEATLDNNSAPYVLRVVDEPIRVLVLEGKPYWDSKFFTRTLTADPAIALDSIVKLNDTRLVRRTLSRESAASTQRTESWKIVTDAASVLASPDSLHGYQIVVLGRDAEAFLSDAAVANLAEWIASDGGALVCYRGAPAAQINPQLAKLLPVKWQPQAESRFHVRLTDQGKGMRWFDGDASGDALGNLPSLVTDAHADRTKPLATVLATSIGADGQQTPAVIYQPYGAGRVVVVEGTGMWRWAFLPPEHQQQDPLYTSLWHSLMRWLTSGTRLSSNQAMMLRADKIRFATDEPATVTLLARKDITKVPAVELVSGNSSRPFAPTLLGNGVYRVSFGDLSAGHYQARLAGAKADDANAQVAFDVRSISQEQLNLEARPDLMARIASDSGGAVLGSDDPAEFANQFNAHLAQSRPPRIERMPAWDHGWALAAVLMLWTLSWTLRRSGGLV
jgi:hypothetical protein